MIQHVIKGSKNYVGHVEADCRGAGESVTVLSVRQDAEHGRSCEREAGLAL